MWETKRQYEEIIKNLEEQLKVADEMADAIDHILDSELGCEDWKLINTAAKKYKTLRAKARSATS